MAPVAKRTSEQGQISIFFSASLVVLISIVAFVINVGLFVKAKINLQNATDAAAFAGAAVQSRQLSQIGYLNWEMRNIYKEWMYKYYVVGSLNINDVENPSGNDSMSYRLETDVNAITGSRADDYYNFPAVCIHIATSRTNICKRYAIPGLPEFGSSNLPGAEEASRAFMDALIATKTADCVERTKLNMLVASTWAFNVLSDDYDNSLAGRGPAILSNRMGAWPAAVELAMRMRNLEYVMNRPPEKLGVCANPGSSADIRCGKSINEVTADNALGNERISKAYYSGYRNLGNEVDNEMKSTFTLTELPPRAPALFRDGASYLLVPPKSKGYEKFYVDLELMMVNYAVFYAAMIPRAERGASEGSGVSGACDVSKVAIPVPGYPLGFTKNPDVLTYYAVKGEAGFSGMFNPFNTDLIKMTAYSAAKPMGGRIGPLLFTQPNDTGYFTSRDANFRSVPYIFSLDFVGTPKKGLSGTLNLGEYTSGAPLPINSQSNQFWLKDLASPIGGKISGGDVQFGVPNLVYDFESGYSKVGYTDQTAKINIVKTSENPQTTKAKSYGLYSKNQLRMFKGNLGTGEITAERLLREIRRVRAPTIYESANYLVPSPDDVNKKFNLDSFAPISGQKTYDQDNLQVYQTFVHAPLIKEGTGQSDVLFDSMNDVEGAVFSFMLEQKMGIDKYKAALNQGAREIYNMGQRLAVGAEGSRSAYEKAAEGVSDINFANTENTQNPKSCKSLAGQYLYFYYGASGLEPGIVGDNTGCPVPLGDQLRKYFSGVNSSGDQTYKSHYRMEYSYYGPNFAKSSHNPPELAMFTGYMPGPMTGASTEGDLNNPLLRGIPSEKMRRNSYSTKFVSLGSVQQSSDFGNYTETSSNFPIQSEGDISRTPGNTEQTIFKNPLDAASIGVDLSNIKY
jgi:hypothetical protein